MGMPTILTPARSLLICLAAAACCSSLAAVEYRWPDDAGVLDVKRDFGAKGDGRTDDTAALKKAIQTALKGDFRNPRMIYLPVGTYLISDALKARDNDGPEDDTVWCNGWRSGLFLCGENREKTVIQLKDACPGFTDPAKSQPVVITGSTGHGGEHGMRKGGFGNEGFQNTLMNFTVDTGKGNPGASGVDFLASNRGTMEEVTVRSGDGSGRFGLDLRRAWPGPALVKNVSVEGFEVGLSQRSMDCGMTYEHLTFTGQTVCVIFADGSPFMSLRGITSRNAVPVLCVDGDNAIINVLDSSFTWTGKGVAPPAITSNCKLVLRNIAVDGYPVLVAKPEGGKGKKGKSDAGPPMGGTPVVSIDGGKGVQKFYSAQPAKRLLPGPEDIPELPIKETPLYHQTDFTTWANPRNFALGSRTAGIQEAIDSGAEIVYLPNGSYRIDEPVILRGKLRKLIGLEARVQAGGRRAQTFIFAGVESGTVILEHLSGGGTVLHDCAQTLVMRKCDLSYQNSLRGTGDMFLEDGMFGHPKVLYPQNLWARQLNSEFGSDPEFTNRHGLAWILGMKVEGDPQAILNIGGVTECWALYSMTARSTDKAPWVENREGWLALSSREGGQGTHKVRFQDQWNGESKTVGGPRETCLFLGGQRFDPTTDKPEPAGPAQAKALSSGSVEVSWAAAKPGKTGLAYYRMHRDGKPLAGVPAEETSFIDTEVIESHSYAYEISAVSLRGGISAPVKTTATTPADAESPKIVEVGAWPGDPTVVTIDFDEPLDAAIAARPSSYVLSPATAVKSARLNAAGDRVILTLAQPLPDSQQTSIACTALKDRSKAGNAVTAPAAFTAWHQGKGLKAEFWNQKAGFDGQPVVTRIDGKIDNWWGDGSPATAVQVDDFSCRWSGFLRPKVSGSYRFQTGCRTGCRLSIDGQVIHDAWTTKNEWTDSKSIDLEAGKRYAIVLESHHDGGGAGMRLKWSGPGIDKKAFLTREFLFPE